MTEPQHGSRPAKRATPAAEGNAGREQTKTATELHRAAMAAVNGYTELTAALTVVGERLDALHAPTAPGPDAGQLTARLVGGEALPEVGELGEAVAAAASRIAAQTYERQLIEGVRDELSRTRAVGLRSGNDAAFEWLNAKLHELLDRGRAIVARLGTVRSADQALDSEHPAQARDALRELQALAGEYAELREAQAMLVGDAAGWSRDSTWTPTWAEQIAAVAEHGTIANPEIGKPPVEMFAQLVWLLDKTPAPVAFVPTFRELRRRADATHPARPARPVEQEPPLTNAAGEDARRLARLRARAGVPQLGA